MRLPHRVSLKQRKTQVLESRRPRRVRPGLCPLIYHGDRNEGVPVLAQMRDDFVWPDGVIQTLDVDPMSLV